MPNALGQAGATVEPSEYAALSMDSQFTGLWTQRSALRDADVPYLYRKFYSASRFDSMIDGINREISPRLTDIRRPGSSVYNSQIFPPIARYYPFKTFSNGKESIRVIADCNIPQNYLQNPDFADNSGAGWTGWGANWTLGGGNPDGGNIARVVGPGSFALTNVAHVPCVPGQVYEATCLGLGYAGSSTGEAKLRMWFYDSSGTGLGTWNSTDNVANNLWNQQIVTATAPATAAYFIVDYALINSTTTQMWGVCQFSAGLYPQAGSVRDVTGPSTNTVIRTKSAGAGRTTFLGVGNVLYGADGVDAWQWVTAAKSWQALTAYQPGDFIVDPNGNIQMAVGSVTANIVNIQVDDVVLGGGTHGRRVTLWFDPSTPFDVPDNIQITTAGLTTVPLANETTPYNLQVMSTQQCSWVQATTGIPVTVYATETGTATTGVGVSGSTPIPPSSWNTAQGLVTQDGTLQWVNMGSAVMPMGGAGPTTAPIVTQALAPAAYPQWAASTWYAPAGAVVIVDGSGNIQQVIVGGQTGASGPPGFVGGPGTITPDGTVQWKNQGPAAWQANHAYAVGAVIRATYTYTTTTFVWVYENGRFVQVPQPTQVSATSVFQVTVAGTSGANTPQWNNGVGTVTLDPNAAGVTWKNMGTGTTYPGASQNISTAAAIQDPTGYIQKPTTQGETGTAIPTSWATGLGKYTTDNTQSWINAGPYAPAGQGTWQWAYSGRNSITGDISNPSPMSPPLVPGVNNAPIVQGLGLNNPPWDRIILWRTAANGVTLLYEDEFANPGPGVPWIYTDTNPDTALNAEMTAPGSASVSTLATPPPSTAVAPEYHCGRIFMINGNYVIYSGGPDTLAGNGNTAFPPQNYFLLPEQPIRLKSITMQDGGLIVFCLANTYVILGDGTRATPDAPPFQAPRMYMENVGLKSYDALCMVGSTFHGMSNKSKVFSFDPGNGYLEIGFPVGDQFARVNTGGIDAVLYDPATVYVTWHERDSTDTGLYVADGAVGWFRWSPIAPPESGSLWSPRAAIVGGTSCVQSVETLPGLFDLLIGPASRGPILKRDVTVRGDWSGGAYQPYPAWDVKGSIGLCETGEVAEIVHIALKSVAAGARPQVSLLLDELKAGVTVEGRTTAWDVLSLDDGHHEDPPNLEPSITMFSDRYRASSTAETPKCENFQLKIDYGMQQVADELLKFAVFGGVFKERRQQ